MIAGRVAYFIMEPSALSLGEILFEKTVMSGEGKHLALFFRSKKKLVKRIRKIKRINDSCADPVVDAAVHNIY